MICNNICKYTAQNDQKKQDHGKYRFPLQLFLKCFFPFFRFLLLPPGTNYLKKLSFRKLPVSYHTLTSESFILGSISSLTVCATKLLKNTINPVISTSIISRL